MQAGNFNVPVSLPGTRALAVLWMAVLGVSVLYCEISAVVFESQPVTIPVSVAWAMQTWSGWIALTAISWVLVRARPARSLAAVAVPGIVVFAASDALCHVVLEWLGFDPRPDTLRTFLYQNSPEWLLGGGLSAIVVAWWRGRGTQEPVPSAVALRAPLTLEVVTRGGKLHVALDSLESIESAGNYVELFTLDGRSLLYRATLKQMLAQVASQGWAQVHRGVIVNGAQIRARMSGYRLKLASGRVVSVGRGYRMALQNAEK
jgi:hypothetical protein